MHHLSSVICHLPSVIRHPSSVIHHPSSVICHLLTEYLYSAHLCSILSKFDSEDLHLVNLILSYFCYITLWNFDLISIPVVHSTDLISTYYYLLKRELEWGLIIIKISFCIIFWMWLTDITFDVNECLEKLGI